MQAFIAVIQPSNHLCWHQGPFSMFFPVLTSKSKANKSERYIYELCVLTPYACGVNYLMYCKIYDDM